MKFELIKTNFKNYSKNLRNSNFFSIFYLYYFLKKSTHLSQVKERGSLFKYYSYKCIFSLRCTRSCIGS